MSPFMYQKFSILSNVVCGYSGLEGLRNPRVRQYACLNHLPNIPLVYLWTLYIGIRQLLMYFRCIRIHQVQLYLRCIETSQVHMYFRCITPKFVVGD